MRFYALLSAILVSSCGAILPPKNPAVDDSLKLVNAKIASFQARFDIADQPDVRPSIGNTPDTKGDFHEIYTALRIAEWEAERIVTGQAGRISEAPARITIEGIRNCRRSVQTLEAATRQDPVFEPFFIATQVVDICRAAQRMQGGE